MESLKKIDCVFFKTSRGAEPVRAWLKKQRADVKKQIGDDIRTVQYAWPDVGRPLVGLLGGGLFEIRTSVFDVDYRVLFSISDGRILLLHAFKKATRALHRADIELAMSRKTASEQDAAERSRGR